MPARRYPTDVLATPRARRATAREVEAEAGLVVEDADGYVGEIVATARDGLTLEDRHGRRRLFRYGPGYFLDGRPVVLIRPRSAPTAGPARTASGSLAVPAAGPRTARASRILVEGVHDAELVERVWGDDLRVEGVVVEPLHGLDDLAGVVAAFGPSATRRLGVLVDHLVPGTKESRLASAVRGPYVLVTGHPYVDVWQAVKPAVLGLAAWPTVPPGQDWKTGVCTALGVATPAQLWPRVLRSVRSYTDLETPLLAAVEQLIDFVTTG